MPRKNLLPVTLSPKQQQLLEFDKELLWEPYHEPVTAEELVRSRLKWVFSGE